MNQLLRSEAAVTTGTAATAVSAVIALVVAFGLLLTMEQKVAILGVVVAVPSFVSGVLTRRHAWSQQSVEAKLAATARDAAAQVTAEQPLYDRGTLPAGMSTVTTTSQHEVRSSDDPGAPDGSTGVR